MTNVFASRLLINYFINGKVWVAAGFKDTLLRCQKSEVVYGYKAAIQPGIQD